MPENSLASPLEFTLGDHDRILKCANGIDQILEKLGAADKRIDGIEIRMKNVEDWKIRVMAIVAAAGIGVGFTVGKVIPLFVSH